MKNLDLKKINFINNDFPIKIPSEDFQLLTPEAPVNHHCGKKKKTLFVDHFPRLSAFPHDFSAVPPRYFLRLGAAS